MQLQGCLRNLLDGPIGGNTTNATQAVSAATNSPSQEISGCGTLSVVLTITGASSPSGASAKLQKSNDGTNWVDITSPASQNITANGTLMFSGGTDLVDPGYKFLRVTFAISTGSFTVLTSVVGKGFVN